MRRLLITLLSLVLLLATGKESYAQLFPRVRSSASPQNQQIILSAMKDAMCLIRYEYQLEDTLSRERFNVEGKDYFGYSEGICIKTSTGWIARQDVIEPWYGSKDVRKFPAYKPVISSITSLANGDSTYHYVDYYPLDSRIAISSSSFVMVEDTITFKGGLHVGEREDVLKGYVVWLTREGDKLSLTSYSHDITSASDSLVFSLGGKAVPSGALGGVFVKATYPEVGTMRLDLLGVIDKEENDWHIVLINNPVKVSSSPKDKPKLVSANGSKKEGESAEGKKNKKNK